MAQIDFEIFGGRIVYLFHPLTRAAHVWINEPVPTDALRLDAIAIARRYIGNVVGGQIADGFGVR